MKPTLGGIDNGSPRTASAKVPPVAAVGCERQMLLLWTGGEPGGVLELDPVNELHATDHAPLSGCIVEQPPLL
jgi:hypothetical protein